MGIPTHPVGRRKYRLFRSDVCIPKENQSEEDTTQIRGSDNKLLDVYESVSWFWREAGVVR